MFNQVLVPPNWCVHCTFAKKVQSIFKVLKYGLATSAAQWSCTPSQSIFVGGALCDKKKSSSTGCRRQERLDGKRRLICEGEKSTWGHKVCRYPTAIIKGDWWVCICVCGGGGGEEWFISPFAHRVSTALGSVWQLLTVFELLLQPLRGVHWHNFHSQVHVLWHLVLSAKRIYFVARVFFFFFLQGDFFNWIFFFLHLSRLSHDSEQSTSVSYS